MTASTDFRIGTKVQHSTDNKIGTVRFIGSVHMASGEWLGLELPDATGKNDGSVGGTRYFTCRPKHGIFIKRENARSYTPPAQTPARATSSSAPTRTISSSAASSSTAPKKTSVRTSMAPPASRRISTVPAASSSRRSMVPGTSKPVVPAASGRSSGASARSQATATPAAVKSRSETPQAAAAVSKPEVVEATVEAQAEIEAEAPKAPAIAASGPPVQNYIEKIELLKQQLKESSEQSEARLKSLSQQLEEEKAQREELEINLEHVILDREVISEELILSQAKVNLLEDELSVTKEERDVAIELQAEEGQEYSEMNAEDLRLELRRAQKKTEMAVDALLQLRDAKADLEREFRAQISSFSEDTEELPHLKRSLEDLKLVTAKQAETIELQKSQMESMSDMEPLIEHLQSQVEALQEDKIKLQEQLAVSEELNGVHEEIIAANDIDLKAFNDQIDDHTAQMAAAGAELKRLTEQILDKDDTLTKYQQVTSQLQDNLREAQGFRVSTEQEKADLEKSNRQLRELTDKSHKSASRTERKKYEDTIAHSEYTLATTHTDILKAYAREGYQAAEPIITTYLTLSKLTSRASALREVLIERTTAAFTNDFDVNKLERVNCTTQLAYIQALCKTMSEQCKRQSWNTFHDFGRRAGNDLKEVESTIVKCTQNILNDSLRETQLFATLNTQISVIRDLAEKYMPEDTREYFNPGSTVGYKLDASLFSTDILGVKTFLTYLKEMFTKTFQITNESDELYIDEYKEHEQALIKSLNSATESEKLIWKINTDLDNFSKQNMILEEKQAEYITSVRATVQEVQIMACDLTKALANIISTHSTTSTDTSEQLTFLDIRSATGAVPYEELIKKLSECTKVLKAIREYTKTPDSYNEVPEGSITAPWEEHIQLLNTEVAIAQDTEKQLSVAKAELQEKNTAIAVTNRAVEELTVKIEVLSKRATDTGSRNDRVVELEKSLKASNQRAESMQSAQLVLQTELAEAKEDNRRLKENVPTGGQVAAPTRIPQPKSSIKEEVILLQNKTLQDIVRAGQAKTQNAAILEFEPLQRPDKASEREGLSQRSSATLKAVMDAARLRKDEEKRSSKGKKKKKQSMYGDALAQLDDFRRGRRWR